uniref:V-set and transmembrane domain containing 5 n=1 Tax=Nothobranchius furzeri TaxID=105023 RepID=A0A8C6KII8_NOTFU
MWHFRLWNVKDIAVFLSISLIMIHSAGAIVIDSSQRSLIRSVQEDVFFSVNVTCSGTPTIQWTFMSGAVSRAVGTWRPEVFTNITMDYSSRVRPYDNGSMVLLDLRLQDAGYYLISVEDSTGRSKELGFILKVNEVLYEDLQYLSVTALALFVLAGLLMLAMWLLHKACRRIEAWRRKRQMPGKEKGFLSDQTFKTE